jgi:hypothetical protein
MKYCSLWMKKGDKWISKSSIIMYFVMGGFKWNWELMNEFANHEVAPIKLEYEQFYDHCHCHLNLHVNYEVNKCCLCYQFDFDQM